MFYVSKLQSEALLLFEKERVASFGGIKCFADIAKAMAAIREFCV